MLYPSIVERSLTEEDVLLLVGDPAELNEGEAFSQGSHTPQERPISRFWKVCWTALAISSASANGVQGLDIGYRMADKSLRYESKCRSLGDYPAVSAPYHCDRQRSLGGLPLTASRSSPWSWFKGEGKVQQQLL